MITKITDIDEFKKNLSPEEKFRMDSVEQELSQASQTVKLGNDQFLLEAFDMSQCIEFSKFQNEYREMMRSNTNVTFEELVHGKDSLVRKIIEFLGIPVDPSMITYKQFKYLMWAITKNYMFTMPEDSQHINAITPFFFV